MKVKVEAPPTHGQILQEQVNEASKKVLILEQAYPRSGTCSQERMTVFCAAVLHGLLKAASNKCGK
jgi:hypothetical protein